MIEERLVLDHRDWERVLAENGEPKRNGAMWWFVTASMFVAAFAFGVLVYAIAAVVGAP